MPPLTFCDVAMFYCAGGGGIRTFTDAKSEWFCRQDLHRYVLIVPGDRTRHRQLTRNVTRVEIRSVGADRRRDGYRVFTDVAAVRAAVRRWAPDVVEAADPWVSGPLMLWRRRAGAPGPLVTSFFHSDPIPTYVGPALRRIAPAAVANPVTAWTARAFWRLQASYDATIVGAPLLAERLQEHGVRRVHTVRFGVDPAFFEAATVRGEIDRPRRLLYAGRLDRDKQVDLLLAAIPRILENPDLSLTIAGTGAYRIAFDRVEHPRLRCIGHIADRSALAEIVANHDVLLAPGAYDTFGLAALEAAAAGLIVVGPDAGGVGRLLREMRSPFLFNAGDVDDFVAAIGRAVAADWTCASHASRGLAATYGTWSDAIGRLVDLYERLVDQKRCTR